MRYRAARLSLAVALLMSALASFAGPTPRAVANQGVAPESILVKLAELPPGFALADEPGVAPMAPDGLARQAAASFRRESEGAPGVSLIRQVVLVFDERDATEYLPRFSDLMVRRQGFTRVSGDETTFRLTRTQQDVTSAVAGQALGEALVLTTVSGAAGTVSPDDAETVTRVAVARVPAAGHNAAALPSDSGPTMSRAKPGSGHLDIPIQADADRFPYPVQNLPGPPSIDVVQQRDRRPTGDPSLNPMMPPPNTVDPRVKLPTNATDVGAFTIGLAPLLDEFWQRALNMTTVDYSSPGMVVAPAGKSDAVGCPVSATKYIPARSLAYCVTDGVIYAYEPFLQDERLAGSDWRSRDYVIVMAVAHEWGHHIQMITNLIPASEILMQNNPEIAPLASRQIELQADCYAGLFTRYARDRGWLNPGDIGEAAEAMIRIGDEHTNESGHHGLPEQRKEWFMRGYVHYAFRACDPW